MLITFYAIFIMNIIFVCLQVTIPDKGPKVTAMVWSGLDDFILTGRFS